MESDVHIGNVYFVPPGSVHGTEDPISLLNDELQSIPSGCNVLICGDYNGRTGMCKDILSELYDGSDGDLINLTSINNQINAEYEFATFLERNDIIARHSMDKITNKRGKELLDLCRACGLLIINGRVGKDKGIGKFTRIESTRKSVVDYMICTPRIMQEISDFEVCPELPESDHLALALSIKVMSRGEEPKSSENSHQSWDWMSCHKYEWTSADLHRINDALKDYDSKLYHDKFINSIMELENVQNVAIAFGGFINQACERVCKLKKVNQGNKSIGPKWFDTECRLKRAEAVKVGEMASGGTIDIQRALQVCGEYRAMKQRKRRNFVKNNLKEVEQAFNSNRTEMWKILNNLNNKRNHSIGPAPHDILDYFKKLSTPPISPHFNYEYENAAKEFLEKYDSGTSTTENGLAWQILNKEFDTVKISGVIDKLKCNKAQGIDLIPAEFVKYCKDILVDDLCKLYNYILGKREFPDAWAEGLRTAVYKAGYRLDPNNYRGITVLPIFAKIFEIAFHDRLQLVCEAFGLQDEYNGGFVKGNMTADNMFILNSLIQRQILKGDSLIVCFVDFSKAFDVISRNILFYKLIKYGIHGRIIDTMRSLYSKTHFRVKCNGKISHPVFDVSGVNQGGSASSGLFRRYLADLSEYLSCSVGVCLDEEIVLHLLWADDLLLISDTMEGIGKQLDGLAIFCSKNLMILNETKTKLLVFGKDKFHNVTNTVTFNNKLIERNVMYKYLGNIFSETRTIRGDVFKHTYDYLCVKSQRALFSLNKQLNHLGKLPP